MSVFDGKIKIECSHKEPSTKDTDILSGGRERGFDVFHKLY